MSEGEIRIYVACLAAYNNSILHGKWMDADREPWEIYDDICSRRQARTVAPDVGFQLPLTLI